MKQAKKRPVVAGLKGLVRRPENPVSIEAMNTAIAAVGAKATRLMQDWLGHRDIRHTAWYSRTRAKRFDGVWE